MLQHLCCYSSSGVPVPLLWHALCLLGSRPQSVLSIRAQQQQLPWLPQHAQLKAQFENAEQQVWRGYAAACGNMPHTRHTHTAAATQEQRASASSRSSSRQSSASSGRTHRPLFRQPGRKTAAAEATTAAVDDSEADEEDHEDTAAPTDLRHPQQWYAAARAVAPRSLTAHLGPTNSGKTHAAIAALAAAPSGVYCGPLRLLACEVADRLNSMGVRCNLVTGQEVRRVKGARHTACTVEMADLTNRVDVAVLDEVQMLGDKGRGWSWTRVLLGLPAGQLHLCGDPAAAQLLEQLAAACGDQLTIKSYRRLAPLLVEPQAVGGLQQIQEGDCVIAFGRKTLHKLRANILRQMLAGRAAEAVDTYNPDSPWDTSTDSDTEFGEPSGWYSNSGSSSDGDDNCQQQQQQQQQQQEAAARAFQGVGMVYGALPPESRRTQAALFNARGDSGPRTSVLVASDAVGMGLNLNIRRIVFTNLHKFDGAETRPLSASEIKQIAGRAGRYASGHAEGYVSVLSAEDLPLLREALATATPPVMQACLLPRYEQLEQFALEHEEAQQQHHTDSLGRRQQRPLTFHKLLNSFMHSSQLSDAYFLADMKNMLHLAKMLRHIEPHLSLADMYTCCISPASADDGPVVQALLQIASSYAFERLVTPDCITLPCPEQAPRSPAEMKSAEELFRVYDLYLWLYDRLGAPGVFKGRKRVLRLRQTVAELIDVALQRMGGLSTGGRWGSAPGKS